MRHIVALSGGKDSTAMALRLMETEPADYKFVITPTGDELPEMLDHWKRLEAILGQPMTVISSGHSLPGLIRRWDALPNWRQRWCTRVLKLEPFNTYLMESLPATSYVGLRADEELRKGVVYGEVDGVERRYPLREWDWGLSEVQDYLTQRDVAIPKRTDCARCFFQRADEWFTLWQKHPEIYALAEDDERRTGYTFRSPGGNRDKFPVSLRELREGFARDHRPKGAGQFEMFSSDREGMCRVCTL